MVYRNRCARVNIKLLAILIVIPIMLGASLVTARQIRRSILSERALAAGTAAFEEEDWPAASQNFRNYLGSNPNDVEILRKYAEACLSIRPLDATAISGAISAYRRIVELAPLDDTAYEKLAMLYGGVKNFEELVSMARIRLQGDPNHLKAPLWLADAFVRQNRTAEARQTLETFIEKLDTRPGKHVEYVRACAQMSQLAAGEASTQPKAMAEGENSSRLGTPLDWLNRAVDYWPDSAEALVNRAQLQRWMAETTDSNEQAKSSLLALARKDLEAADATGTEAPRIRYVLGVEWMAHGEPNRAAAELQAVDRLPQDRLKESFFDLSEWTVARFLLASELATQKRVPAEAASLADEALASLTGKEHRVQVLSFAIPLYVVAGRVSDARRSLDEYQSLWPAQGGAAQSSQRLAGLQALVASAENRPYAVIDALEPVIRNDPSATGLWRLLAEAYERTGQAGRAVKALAEYHRLNPQDAEATRKLARQYSKLGDWSKTLEAAGAAESSGSTELAVKLLRITAGVNLAIRQRDAVHIEEIRKLSAELADLRRTDPNQVDIRILQAVITDYLGRPDEAEKELKLAIEECREPLKARVQLAAHYLGAKRADEAIAICETACDRHSQAAEPWLCLADVHAVNANYDSARRCLEQGLNTITESQEKRSLSIKLAVLELVRGDRTTGINLLRKLASQDQQEIQARSLLLGVREVQQDPAAAQTLISELRQAEGECGLWWRLHQASLWLLSNDWSSRQQEITNLLRYCMDADPSWSAPALLLAGMHERSGDPKRFEDTCRQGLLGNPSAADIADRLLVHLERQRRFPDAEKVLRQLDLSPRLASAWQVRVALGAKDYSRAIDALKLTASNDGQDAASRIQLARLVYQETRDADQALEYLKQAEAITPDSQALVTARASILRGEGKTAEAVQVLDDYVAAHDEFDAYWMRAVYLAAEGSLDRAETDYQKLTTLVPNAAMGYELLGNFYVGTKRLDQGIAAIEKGLGAHPEDLRLQRRLMQLLLLRANTPDRERALVILAALEERLPHDVELITTRARQMLQEPTPPSLVTIRARLEDAVRLEPTAINTHLTLVAIAMRQREYKAACDYAIRALESNPNNPALLSARGRAELALGYAPMAVKLAREALGQEPNSVEALSVIVDSALRSTDRDLLEQARTLLEPWLARNPDNERLLISGSHVLAALEMPKAAIPRLEAYCRSKAGGSITALVTLADLYRLAGDAEGARQWIEQAERLDPGNQAVVHARFLWLVSQNRTEELSHISSAYVAAKQQDPIILLRAASTLLAIDSMELKNEAVKLFERATVLAPDLADARVGLASGLYQTGDVDRAEQIYRQLLEQHPDDVRVLNDLAWILQERHQQYAEALELANRGLRLAPDDLHLLDTRGTILSNMPERLVDARSDFEELVKLSSSDTRRHAKALLQLGRVCAKLSDLPEARRHLEDATAIDQKIHVFTPGERSEISHIVQMEGSS